MSKRWREMSQRERDGRGSANWRRVRASILAESDVCWLCGRPGADTVDHVVPLKDGGTSERANLRPAHGKRQPWGCPGNFGRRDRGPRVVVASREW